jgi:hypothetical protein
VTDRLHFTGNDEADRLLVQDPFALLVGFALDQQVTVEKAFMGPLMLRERLGTLEPAAMAGADLRRAGGAVDPLAPEARGRRLRRRAEGLQGGEEAPQGGVARILTRAERREPLTRLLAVAVGL